MIPIQPPFQLLPTYRPIAFEAKVTILDTVGPAENALVTINKGGVDVVLSIPYKSIRNEPALAPGFTDYYFDIDIQKYCQDLLGPFAALPSIFPSKTDMSAQNNELFDYFYIKVSYQYISLADGLLKTIPVGDISNSYCVFAASRKNQELMSLEDYLGTTPITPDRLFLTKSARVLNVCEDDNAFLSVLQEDGTVPTNGISASFYDSSGALLDFGLAFLPSPTIAGQLTVNTGLDSLANMTWVLGAPVLPNPLIASYVLTFGSITVTGGPTYSYLRQTEDFTYNVINHCCDRKSLRLHWMNLLGGADSYTFDENKDLQIATNHSTGQKALGWIAGSTSPNIASDIGSMKLKSEGLRFYNLNSKILTNAQSLWLSEMLTSPKVYAQINGDFIAVIVEKTTQSIGRDKGKIRFPITVTLANDLIIQRS